MTKYLVRRVLQGVATVFVVITLAFILGRVAGSPAAIILPSTATQEQFAQLEASLGLDKPLFVQYLDYMGALFTGDFGESYLQRGTSSMALVLQRLPATLLLGVWGLFGAVLLAFVSAVLFHFTRSQKLRAAILGLGSFRQSMPDFLFALLLILIFSVGLRWFPSLGYSSALSLVLPVITIATAQFIAYLRLLDNSLAQEASLDYARTARVRGEKPRNVLLRELLPNAVLPVLTFAGIHFGSLLGGLVIVENVFAWPGLGQLMLTSMFSRDFAVVQSGLIAIAILFVAINFIIDLLYGAIDPRVRLK